jgi:hypothetical protein
MAISKSAIIEKVKLNLNSGGVGTYYSDEDLSDCFDDVYDDIVCHALPFEKSTEISLVGNKVYYDLYSTIQDYILPLSIYHQESNRWLVQKSERYLETINNRWEQQHGNPIYFVVIDYKYIAIYPHPKETTGTLTLYYKYRPQVHVGSDTVVLSSHSDLMFTNGMTEDLLAQGGEYQKSMSYFQEYFKQMREESDLTESRTSPDRIYRLAMQELRNYDGR